jgi:hypothetical protein
MPNWVISCHGYSDTKSGKAVKITTRQKYENCQVPTGVELVTYTKQGESLSMDEGWALWELLVEDNNEAAAYARRHKSKTNQAIINYGLSGPHDAADFNGWLSNAVPPVCACGIFEVGNQVALETFQIAMQHCTLADVLNRAKAANVARVYYLACQELG